MRVVVRGILLLLSSLLWVLRLAGQGTPNPVPQINQPTIPMTAAPGGSALTLNVYGAGFVPTSTVKWNGSVRQTTFISEAHVTAAIPATDIAAKGTGFVTVSNPPPGGGSSNALYFGITDPVSSVAFAASYPADLNSLLTQGSFFISAVGDFNGDGKLDLAIVLGDTGKTVIALGSGDGTFQPTATYAAGSSPHSVLTCDLNNDGKLDLIVGNNDGTLTILLGMGDGTFQPKAPVLGNHEFFVGDFNRDGKLDLAIDANGGGIFILLGNGDGTFQGPVSYGSGPVTPAAVGDFNGDGILDILTSGNLPPQVSLDPVILLGNGDGTFQASPTPTGISPLVLLVADLNGDGKLDVATQTQVPPSNCDQAWQLGTGNGTFQAPTGDFGSGTRVCTGGIVGDLNGDGKLDVAVSNAPGQPGMGFFSGNGDGTVRPPVIVASNSGVALNPITIADLNGDGQMDVVAEDDQGKVWILLQGLFPAATIAPATLSFGTQIVGTASALQTLTLTNTGTAALNITGVAATPEDFSIERTCGGSVSPGQSCTIEVVFDPTMAGTRGGTLIVTASDGATQQISLTGTGQDFSVSTSGAVSATVTAGQTASYTVAFSSAGGFSQMVTLGCSGAPAYSTCTVAPNSLQVGETSTATATVTVTTTARPMGFVLPSGSDGPLQRYYRPMSLLAGLLAMMILSLFAWRQERQRREWTPVSAFALLLCTTLTLSSCGGYGGTGGRGGGTIGTQAGTYMITVSGGFTSGSTMLTHTTKLTLVVQ